MSSEPDLDALLADIDVDAAIAASSSSSSSQHQNENGANFHTIHRNHYSNNPKPYPFPHESIQRNHLINEETVDHNYQYSHHSQNHLNLPQHQNQQHDSYRYQQNNHVHQPPTSRPSTYQSSQGASSLRPNSSIAPSFRTQPSSSSSSSTSSLSSLPSTSSMDHQTNARLNSHLKVINWNAPNSSNRTLDSSSSVPSSSAPSSAFNRNSISHSSGNHSSLLAESTSSASSFHSSVLSSLNSSPSFMNPIKRSALLPIHSNVQQQQQQTSKYAEIQQQKQQQPQQQQPQYNYQQNTRSSYQQYQHQTAEMQQTSSNLLVQQQPSHSLTTASKTRNPSLSSSSSSSPTTTSLPRSSISSKLSSSFRAAPSSSTTKPQMSDKDIEEICNQFNSDPSRIVPISSKAIKDWHYPASNPPTTTSSTLSSSTSSSSSSSTSPGFRRYQYTISSNALHHNTLVCLPTGLGKTFIASVLILNYHRFYPTGLILFLAPTRPLVSQQIKSCITIAGIAKNKCVELNGNMKVEKRKELWSKNSEANIIFSTPQTIMSDIHRGSCPIDRIVCVIIDEAHRAIGKYSYVSVIKEMTSSSSTHFRVLALSATPGGDVKTIQSVIHNLLITNVEVKEETDPDIAPYVFKREQKIEVVEKSEELDVVEGFYLECLQMVMRRLHDRKVYFEVNANCVRPFGVHTALTSFRSDPPSHIQSKNLLWIIQCEFRLLHCLALAKNKLEYGLQGFYDYLKEKIGTPIRMGGGREGVGKEESKGELPPCEAKTEIRTSHAYRTMLAIVEKYIEGIGEGRGGRGKSNRHPKMAKLEEIVAEHFEKLKEATRDEEQSLASRYLEELTQKQQYNRKEAEQEGEDADELEVEEEEQQEDQGLEIDQDEDFDFESNSRHVSKKQPNPKSRKPSSSTSSSSCSSSRASKSKTPRSSTSKLDILTLESATGGIIIFTELRESVAEIVTMLQQHSPLVRPAAFIGQGNAGGAGAGGGKKKGKNAASVEVIEEDVDGFEEEFGVAPAAASKKSRSKRGQSQQEQSLVLTHFKSGYYNVLVATSIGEEGLDLGSVDCIIAYDSLGSPLRIIQRFGRTGRRREGKCYTLLMKGKEEQSYQENQIKYKGLMKKMKTKIGNEIKLCPKDDKMKMIPDKIIPQVKWIQNVEKNEVNEEELRKEKEGGEDEEEGSNKRRRKSSSSSSSSNSSSSGKKRVSPPLPDRNDSDRTITDLFSAVQERSIAERDQRRQQKRKSKQYEIGSVVDRMREVEEDIRSSKMDAMEINLDDDEAIQNWGREEGEKEEEENKIERAAIEERNDGETDDMPYASRLATCGSKLANSNSTSATNIKLKSRSSSPSASTSASIVSPNSLFSTGISTRLAAPNSASSSHRSNATFDPADQGEILDVTEETSPAKRQKISATNGSTTNSIGINDDTASFSDKEQPVNSSSLLAVSQASSSTLSSSVPPPLSASSIFFPPLHDHQFHSSSLEFSDWLLSQMDGNQVGEENKQWAKETKRETEEKCEMELKQIIEDKKEEKEEEVKKNHEMLFEVEGEKAKKVEDENETNVKPKVDEMKFEIETRDQHNERKTMVSVEKKEEKQSEQDVAIIPLKKEEVIATPSMTSNFTLPKAAEEEKEKAKDCDVAISPTISSVELSRIVPKFSPLTPVAMDSSPSQSVSSSATVPPVPDNDNGAPYRSSLDADEDVSQSSQLDAFFYPTPAQLPVQSSSNSKSSSSSFYSSRVSPSATITLLSRATIHQQQQNRERSSSKLEDRDTQFAIASELIQEEKKQQEQQRQQHQLQQQQQQQHRRPVLPSTPSFPVSAAALSNPILASTSTLSLSLPPCSSPSPTLPSLRPALLASSSQYYDSETPPFDLTPGFAAALESMPLDFSSQSKSTDAARSPPPLPFVSSSSNGANRINSASAPTGLSYPPQSHQQSLPPHRSLQYATSHFSHSYSNTAISAPALTASIAASVPIYCPSSTVSINPSFSNSFSSSSSSSAFSSSSSFNSIVPRAAIVVDEDDVPLHLLSASKRTPPKLPTAVLGTRVALGIRMEELQSDGGVGLFQTQTVPSTVPDRLDTTSRFTPSPPSSGSTQRQTQSQLMSEPQFHSTQSDGQLQQSQLQHQQLQQQQQLQSQQKQQLNHQRPEKNSAKKKTEVIDLADEDEVSFGQLVKMRDQIHQNNNSNQSQQQQPVFQFSSSSAACFSSSIISPSFYTPSITTAFDIPQPSVFPSDSVLPTRRLPSLDFLASLLTSSSPSHLARLPLLIDSRECSSHSSLCSLLRHSHSLDLRVHKLSHSASYCLSPLSSLLRISASDLTSSSSSSEHKLKSLFSLLLHSNETLYVLLFDRDAPSLAYQQRMGGRLMLEKALSSLVNTSRIKVLFVPQTGTGGEAEAGGGGGGTGGREAKGDEEKAIAKLIEGVTRIEAKKYGKLQLINEDEHIANNDREVTQWKLEFLESIPCLNSAMAQRLLIEFNWNLKQIVQASVGELMERMAVKVGEGEQTEKRVHLLSPERARDIWHYFNRYLPQINSQQK